MKMIKKYQLKENFGNKLVIICESDIIFDILKYIDQTLETIEYLSLWMDGWEGA